MRSLEGKKLRVRRERLVEGKKDAEQLLRVRREIKN